MKSMKFVFPLLVVLYFFLRSNTTPDGFLESSSRIDQIYEEQLQILKKINEAVNPAMKSMIAKEYIEKADQFENELLEIIAFLETERSGHSMTIETKITGKIYHARQNLEILQECSRILKNALNGFVDPADKALAKFEPMSKLGNLFPATKQKKE